MSSKKRPLPAKKPPIGCPGWMMTFGDCMSLLVTFFVMMIAFSTMEEARLAAMIGVLQGAFGVVDLGPPQGIIQRKSVTDTEVEKKTDTGDTVRGEADTLRFLTPEEMADALPNFINEIKPQGVELVPDRILGQMLDEGLSIVLQTTNLFLEGTATWQRDFQPLWQGIDGLLRGRDNEIRVTAVTSATAPVRQNVAASSWGLGVIRANRIATELQTTMQSPPARFGVGVQVYDDESSRAANDHVEIMIMERARVTDIGSESTWPKGMWR